jgi:hypothetical protein
VSSVGATKKANTELSVKHPTTIPKRTMGRKGLVPRTSFTGSFLHSEVEDKHSDYDENGCERRQQLEPPRAK